MSIKVLQISTVCGSGSVGRILVDICHTLEKNGDVPLVAYGRRKAPEGIHAYRFGSVPDMALHVLSTFFKGEHGFASKGQTRRLIRQIRRWDPDVIHLHNIHGFILQTELLFEYLKEAGKPVVWTLHDCWPYTGHCAFYDYHGCDRWKTGCSGCREYRRTYPYALFKNRTERNYIRKKAAYTGVPDLVLAVPSRWLKAEAEQSFLKEYPIKVIPNGIDRQQFCPTESRLRETLELSGTFVILGVANVWERRKGLSYLLWLAERLPEGYQVILIGLSKKQIRGLPGKVIGLERTSSVRELAEYYSMADVFVNATLEDNFPTTNLEALSCGTPVITFDTGGSPESLDESCGRVVPKGDSEALLQAVLLEKEEPKSRKACLRRAAQYEKYGRFQEYVKLYHELAGRGGQMSTLPKVSVITTTYNDAVNLERVMDQVARQDYENLEYIIVDGGSTDGTMELIRRMEERMPGRVRWISEPDGGIYDAINKGIRLASGDIIGCCFDRYADDNVITRMVQVMEAEGTDGVHGDLYYMEGERIVRRWHQGQGSIRTGWLPGHPTMYLRKEVYDRFGVYRTDYRIAADYEFMVRILYRRQVSLSYLPEILIYMSYGGTSSKSLHAYLESLREGHRALRENQVPFAWVTDLCRIARVLVQFVKK